MPKEMIEELIEKIEKDIGAIEALIYNLGAQSGFKNLAETSKNLNKNGKPRFI